MSTSQITVQDILEFEKKYKGSDEEKQDLIQLYEQHKGDMNAITESAMCCTQEDEPRICSIIQAAIDGGEVKAFSAFTRETEKKKKARRKRVRKLSIQSHWGLDQSSSVIVIWLSPLHLNLQADKERQEAEEMQKELGLGSQSDSLVMMLQVKQKSTFTIFEFASLLSSDQTLLLSLFYSNDRSPESRISTVSCLIWNQSTRKKGKVEKQKKQRSETLQIKWT